MPGAIIAFDQDQGGTPSYGSPGVARNDLWLNGLVTCRSTASGNTSYLWEILDKPVGSAATLADSTSQNATFTPDVAGSYRIQLTTNGGGPGNVQILIAAVTKDTLGATTQRGWRIPAFGEGGTENNFAGQSRGWAEALKFILDDIRTNLGGGGGGTAAGACTLEQFGAVGDGVTDDQAAWDAAFVALTAGTYRTLLLGAKTYFLGSGGNKLLPAGCSILGQGSATILKTSTNASVIKVVSAAKCLVGNFRIEGSGGSASQVGVQVGAVGTASSCPVDFYMFNVYAKNLGWGFVLSENAIAYQGPCISDCIADGNAVGGWWLNTAEYTTLANCSSVNHGAGAGSPIGVLLQAGNVVWTGGNITHNGVGVQVDDGANGIHGSFNGTTINHNAVALKVNGAGNLTAGHKFVGCHFYGGDLWLVDCIGFQFLGCTFGVADYIFQGSIGTLFSNCKFDSTAPGIFDDYLGSQSSTRWENCTLISDGRSVPSFVGVRTHLRYTFPSDSNQTLTPQQSMAEVIDIQSGVLTASRTLTLAHPPRQGNFIAVKNGETSTVTVAWSSGTGVMVGAGKTAMVGADGTNAVLFGG